MKKALKEKLETVVALVDKLMVDPDLEIDYCIPGVETTADDCDVNAVPFILAKYAENNYVDLKIHLTEKYLQKSAEDIANLVTFYIEQFTGELDSVRYGAQ